jgi:hypothetical protein
MKDETQELVTRLLDLEIKEAHDFDTVKQLNDAYFDLTRHYHPRYLAELKELSVDKVLLLTIEQKKFLIDRISTHFTQKDNNLYRYLTGRDHTNYIVPTPRKMLIDFLLSIGTGHYIAKEIFKQNE